MKFNENRSNGSGDMKRIRKCYRRNDRLTDRRAKGIPKNVPPLDIDL